jgi:hypothetical protein
MLSHHRCVSVPELPGHPFDRNVTRQHLAGKGVATLVCTAVADLCLFQMSGKPVAQCLAAPEQTTGRAAEKKPDFHLLGRDVVALYNGDLFDYGFLGSGNYLPHQFEGWVYQFDDSDPGAFFGYFEFADDQCPADVYQAGFKIYVFNGEPDELG